MRPKSFFINGGAGRVLCSIPALEKYKEDHPEEDFVIVCEGGMDLYRGHPELHKHCFESWHKNLFQDKLKDTDMVSPEPYRVWEYYNQKANLSQAFDIAINGKGLRDLPAPTIKLTRDERTFGAMCVAEVRELTKKKKTVVFQPFGRGVQTHGNVIFDPSGRSFEYHNAASIVRRLQKKYSVIWMSEFPFNWEAEGLKEPVSVPRDINIRQWASIIAESDLFLGCDSVGQHIAYAFDKPVVAVMGSTFGENVSYPDHPKFDVLDMGEGKRVYDPIRISMDDETVRTNDGIMDMNDKIEEVILKSVDKLMNKYYRKPEFEYKFPQNQGCGPQGCGPEAKPSAPPKVESGTLPMLGETPEPIDLKTVLKNTDKPNGFSNNVKTKV